MALLNAEQTKAKHEKDRADKAAIIRREADEEKVRKAFNEGKASTESRKAPMADTTGHQGAQGKVRESWADETKRKAGIKKEAEEIKKAKGKEPAKQEEKKEEKPVQDDSPILDRSNIVLPPEPEPFPAAPVVPAPVVPVAPMPVLPQIKSKDQRSAELESDILDMKRSIDELKDAIDTQKASDSTSVFMPSTLPDGSVYDMIYSDGTDWQLLYAPSNVYSVLSKKSDGTVGWDFIKAHS